MVASLSSQICVGRRKQFVKQLQRRDFQDQIPIKIVVYHMYMEGLPVIATLLKFLAHLLEHSKLLQKPNHRSRSKRGGDHCVICR
jgi:hypothetical protein